jgi:hypothetical protein
VAGNVLKLSAFLALAQHEVQQTLEYLAQPELRRVGPDAPAPVLATVGNVKLTVPLQFAIGATPALPPTAPGKPADPAEILLPGAPWPPGSKLRYQINVATVPACTETGFPALGMGSLQIEFITVVKS